LERLLLQLTAARGFSPDQPPLTLNKDSYMNEINLKRGAKKAAIGAVAACAACCVSVPFIAPLLAWLGISSLGAIASGWDLAMAGIFAIGLAGFFLMRRRRAVSCSAAATKGECDCGGSCKL